MSNANVIQIVYSDKLLLKLCMRLYTNSASKYIQYLSYQCYAMRLPVDHTRKRSFAIDN